MPWSAHHRSKAIYPPPCPGALVYLKASSVTMLSSRPIMENATPMYVMKESSCSTAALSSHSPTLAQISYRHERERERKREG